MVLDYCRRQKKVPAVLNPALYNTHDLRIGYAEVEQTVSKEDYLKINRRWVELADVDMPWTEEDRALFLRVHGNESVRTYLRLLEEDGAFRSQAKDFLDRAVQFTEQTGEPLDANSNNIIFYQQPDNQMWQYTLVDALGPGTIAGWMDVVRPALRMANNRQGNFSPQDRSGIKNTLGYIRVVNALRCYLQLPGRIALFPPHEARMLRPETWQRVLTVAAK